MKGFVKKYIIKEVEDGEGEKDREIDVEREIKWLKKKK